MPDTAEEPPRSALAGPRVEHRLGHSRGHDPSSWRSPSLSRHERGLWSLLAWIGSGLAVLGGGSFLLSEVVRVRETSELLGESGLIEAMQLGFLFLAIFALLLGARHIATGPFARLFALILCAAAIRELDGPLDAIHHGSWKYPAWLLISIVIVLWRRQSGTVGPAFLRVLRSRPGGVIIGSLFILLILARTLGRQVVWQAALRSEYSRVVPRLVEECSELAGYALLAFGCVDWVANLDRRRVEEEVELADDRIWASQAARSEGSVDHALNELPHALSDHGHALS